MWITDFMDVYTVQYKTWMIIFSIIITKRAAMAHRRKWLTFVMLEYLADWGMMTWSMTWMTPFVPMTSLITNLWSLTNTWQNKISSIVLSKCIPINDPFVHPLFTHILDPVTLQHCHAFWNEPCKDFIFLCHAKLCIIFIFIPLSTIYAGDVAGKDGDSQKRDFAHQEFTWSFSSLRRQIRSPRSFVTLKRSCFHMISLS